MFFISAAAKSHYYFPIPDSRAWAGFEEFCRGIEKQRSCTNGPKPEAHGFGDIYHGIGIVGHSVFFKTLIFRYNPIEIKYLSEPEGEKFLNLHFLPDVFQ